MTDQHFSKLLYSLNRPKSLATRIEYLNSDLEEAINDGDHELADSIRQRISMLENGDYTVSDIIEQIEYATAKYDFEEAIIWRNLLNEVTRDSIGAKIES